jgi:hypothetical protein
VSQPSNVHRIERADTNATRLPADGVPAEARGLERAILGALDRARDHLSEASGMLGIAHLRSYGDSKDLGMVAALCGIGESLHVLATIAALNADAEKRR